MITGVIAVLVFLALIIRSHRMASAVKKQGLMYLSYAFLFLSFSRLLMGISGLQYEREGNYIWTYAGKSSYGSAWIVIFSITGFLKSETRFFCELALVATYRLAFVQMKILVHGKRAEDKRWKIVKLVIIGTMILTQFSLAFYKIFMTYERMDGMANEGVFYPFKKDASYNGGHFCATMIGYSITTSVLVFFIITVMQMWHLLRHHPHLRLNETNMMIKLTFGILMMSAYLTEVVANAYMMLSSKNNKDAINYFEISAWTDITYTLVCFASDMLVAVYFWWLMGLRVQ